jgi:hypothetical protein
VRLHIKPSLGRKVLRKLTALMLIASPEAQRRLQRQHGPHHSSFFAAP